jgi:hypothetical protein
MQDKRRIFRKLNIASDRVLFLVLFHCTVYGVQLFALFRRESGSISVWRFRRKDSSLKGALR